MISSVPTHPIDVYVMRVARPAPRALLHVLRRRLAPGPGAR